MSTRQLPSFGDLLREYRQRAELTQEELAERASLSTQAISALERGLNRRPRKDTVQLLVDALHLPAPEQAAFAAAARPPRRFSGPGRAQPDPTPTQPLPALTVAGPDRQVTVTRTLPSPQPPLAPQRFRVLPAGGQIGVSVPGTRGSLLIAALICLGLVGLGLLWLALGARQQHNRQDTTLYLATTMQLTALDIASDGRVYTEVSKVFTGTFGVRNIGSDPTSFLGLSIGVRRPTNCADPWNAPALDFPPREGHFTLAPGEDLAYTGTWSLPEPGVYFAEPLQLEIPDHWTGFSPSVRIWFSIREPRTGRLPERGCLPPVPAPSLPAGAPRP